MDEYYLLKQMKREMLDWVCVRIDEFESVLNRMWKRDIGIDWKGVDGFVWIVQ